MGARIPVLPRNDHPNLSLGGQKCFGKSGIFKFFQVQLNHLNNSNSGAFGGQWPGLHGPSSHYLRPHGCSSPHIVTKQPPKPILGATEGLWKRCIGENFQVPLNHLNNSHFGAFK